MKNAKLAILHHILNFLSLLIQFKCLQSYILKFPLFDFDSFSHTCTFSLFLHGMYVKYLPHPTSWSKLLKCKLNNGVPCLFIRKRASDIRLQRSREAHFLREMFLFDGMRQTKSLDVAFTDHFQDSIKVYFFSKSLFLFKTEIN